MIRLSGWLTGSRQLLKKLFLFPFCYFSLIFNQTSWHFFYVALFFVSFFLFFFVPSSSYFLSSLSCDFLHPSCHILWVLKKDKLVSFLSQLVYRKDVWMRRWIWIGKRARTSRKLVRLKIFFNYNFLSPRSKGFSFKEQQQHEQRKKERQKASQRTQKQKEC